MDNNDFLFNVLDAIFSNEEALEHFTEFNEKVDKYMSEGMTEEEASNKVFEDPDFCKRGKSNCK